MKRKNIREISFYDFDNVFVLLKKIRDGKIKLQLAKINQNTYKSNLNDVETGKPKSRSIEQKSEIQNINNIYE